MKIGIHVTGFAGWDGGIDFLKAYLPPLESIDNAKIVAIFTEYAAEEQRVIDFKRWLADYYPDVQQSNIENDWFELSKYVKKNSIDVIFPTNVDLWEDFPIPWVPYVADFQHKYLPELFTEKDIEFRDKTFGDKVNSKRAVIVEAEDVRNDIQKYYPKAQAKVFVMPYTAIPEESWLHMDNIDLSKYNLPEKYFLISNQFWIHKDHETAFKALAMVLKDNNYDCSIVCTGKTSDFRQPDHFDRLKKLIRNLGIENRVFFLGYIPKIDQIKIMCGAVAVIQPTLCEGNPGGGIAYNAISMSIPIILSDLPVNKELTGDNVTFFRKSDPEDLAEQMKNIMRISDPNRGVSADELRCAGQLRLQKLSEAVREAIEYALHESQGYGKSHIECHHVKIFLKHEIKILLRKIGILRKPEIKLYNE